MVSQYSFARFTLFLGGVHEAPCLPECCFLASACTVLLLTCINKKTTFNTLLNVYNYVFWFLTQYNKLLDTLFSTERVSVVMASAICVDPSWCNFSHIQLCGNASNVILFTCNILSIDIKILLLNMFQISNVLTLANTIFMFTRNSNIFQIPLVARLKFYT